MKGTEGREEPTCLPRRRGVGKCSELTQRVRLPELPPEAPAASGDPSRRGSRHSLGPARPASEGKAASTGSAPGQADPLWSGSPPGRASRRKEGGSRGGGGKQSGREQEEEEGGGREGQRPLSRTYQSPRRSNVPAVHPGGACTSPQRSRCSISPTSSAERCSRLSAPRAWNSAQPLQFYRGLQLRLGQGK